jgi:hypothetical protein
MDLALNGNRAIAPCKGSCRTRQTFADVINDAPGSVSAEIADFTAHRKHRPRSADRMGRLSREDRVQEVYRRRQPETSFCRREFFIYGVASLGCSIDWKTRKEWTAYLEQTGFPGRGFGRISSAWRNRREVRSTGSNSCINRVCMRF